MAVIFPPTQSKMVVTSPMGDHAPPAFAEIITIQAYLSRSLRSGTNLRNTAINTIAAARLSRKAENIKVEKQIYHNNLRLFAV